MNPFSIRLFLLRPLIHFENLRLILGNRRTQPQVAPAQPLGNQVASRRAVGQSVPAVAYLHGVGPRNFPRQHQQSSRHEGLLAHRESHNEQPDLGDRPVHPGEPSLRSQLNGATYWARKALRRKAGTALGAASSKNCTTCARTHPQPKAVRLCTTTIVGLESALHDRTPASWKNWEAREPEQKLECLRTGKDYGQITLRVKLG